ncbi:hypothetical protein ANCDUO_25124, partial [Ancylostoma duodenale]
MRMIPTTTTSPKPTVPAATTKFPISTSPTIKLAPISTLMPTPPVTTIKLLIIISPSVPSLINSKPTEFRIGTAPISTPTPKPTIPQTIPGPKPMFPTPTPLKIIAPIVPVVPPKTTPAPTSRAIITASILAAPPKTTTASTSPAITITPATFVPSSIIKSEYSTPYISAPYNPQIDDLKDSKNVPDSPQYYTTAQPFGNSYTKIENRIEPPQASSPAKIPQITIPPNLDYQNIRRTFNNACIRQYLSNQKMFELSRADPTWTARTLLGLDDVVATLSSNDLLVTRCKKMEVTHVYENHEVNNTYYDLLPVLVEDQLWFSIPGANDLIQTAVEVPCPYLSIQHPKQTQRLLPPNLLGHDNARPFIFNAPPIYHQISQNFALTTRLQIQHLQQ